MNALVRHRATISYNSCRNRHCPKCQTAARERWIAAPSKRTSPDALRHVVFTLPSQLTPLVLQNKKVIYDLLSAPVRKLYPKSLATPDTSARTRLLHRAAHLESKLGLHPHVHCVIPAGGLSLDHTHWINHAIGSSLPITCSVRFSAASLLLLSGRALRNGNSNFHGDLSCLAQPKIFALATSTVPKRLG